MRGETKALIWGIILIVVGLIFLGNNLGWFYFSWENFWPLLMIGGGLLFWIGWFAKREEIGLIMPGTILILYGLLFLYCTYYDWYLMNEYWPVFLFAPGLGFLLMYVLGPHERGLLVPAGVLILLSILFWSGRDVFRFFWPILLIAIGLYLLIKSRRKASEAPEEPNSETKVER
ncbi:MAG: hypothetical protein Kow0042_29160 [Calditrichia bacterium]